MKNACGGPTAGSLPGTRLGAGDGRGGHPGSPREHDDTAQAADSWQQLQEPSQRAIEAGATLVRLRRSALRRAPRQVELEPSQAGQAHLEAARLRPSNRGAKASPLASLTVTVKQCGHVLEASVGPT